MNKDKITEIIRGNVTKDFKIYKNSFRSLNGFTYFLIKIKNEKYIGTVCSNTETVNSFTPARLYREIKAGNEFVLKLYAAENENINRLKKIFPDLVPAASNKNCSFGLGDRLGLATPGHIMALKKFGNIFPFFAQQSVREIEKTQRDFESVLNSAVIGVFQEGYDEPWGADADHIKEKKDIISAIDAGFTMFTIDTSDKLQENSFNSIDNNNNSINSIIFGKNLKKIINNYAGKAFLLKGFKDKSYKLKYSEEIVMDILKMYGKAIDFVFSTYNLIKERLPLFDFEISYDEIDKVTTPLAHYLVADLMKKSGINYTSIALRFPGSFEKGIEYVGDIEKFVESLAIHNSIAENIGGYKLSLHSGSDKLSIYSHFAELTGGRFHVKTSGTSWVEALHVISLKDKELFRKIYELSASTYDKNNQAYHLSLKTDNIPLNLNNADYKNIDSIIYDNNIRQVLHIAYGVILEKYRNQIYEILLENEDDHYNFIKNHINKHLKALV